MKKEINVYDDLGNFIGIDEIEVNGITPQEAIQELHEKFQELCGELNSDDDIPEFNRLFKEWLNKELDLKVEANR